MTTLIAVHNKDRCVGTCDYRCYTALQPSQLREPRRSACTCICGGANHGMGREHAVKNHARGVGLRRADLEAFATRRGLNPDDLVAVDRMLVQAPHKALRLARGLLNPPAPLPLFECQSFDGNHLSEGRRSVKGDRRGAPPTSASPPVDPVRSAG